MNENMFSKDDVDINEENKWTVINNVVIGVIIVGILFVLGQCGIKASKDSYHHQLQQKQLEMIDQLNNQSEKKEALIEFLRKNAKKD